MKKVQTEFRGDPEYTMEKMKDFTIDYLIAHSYLLLYLNNPKEYKKRFWYVELKSAMDMFKMF